MSCEVVDGSPFGDTVLENNLWQDAQSPATELDPIAEFNVGFESNSGSPINDPQLFSNTATTNDFGFDYNMTASGLDQTLSPEPSHVGNYPTDFDPSPTSPYFQSVEANTSPPYQPSPLRNHAFRRSVSEPPGGPDNQPQPPPMMFHRQHHFLGIPDAVKPIPLKSLPKTKTSRPHPYQRAKSKPQYRPAHHRAHTQPLHHVPTSNPMMHHIPQPPPPPQLQYIPQAAMMREPQYLSSRVCTPTPDVGLIDPALSMPTTPTKVVDGATNVVQIPVTVDELRNMIFEAVQQAVGFSDKGEASSVAVCNATEVIQASRSDEAAAGQDKDA